MIFSNQEYDVTLQPYRDINIKLEVLDFDYYVIDEISGLVESADFNIDADSDIRRTCNLSIQLKDEWSSNQLFIDTYFKAGNLFWFDKYLRISTAIKDIVTDEYIWTNQGIYLINEPSISYNADSNTLSFQAVDLMAKLTGLRNGQLEGLERNIDAGSNITDIIKNVLELYDFRNSVILTPPQATTPYDIKLNAGSTAYDLLSELKNINPNWEMFFNVDGVFYYKQILNEETIDSERITPMVNNDMMEELILNYSLDTSFSDVKNYIEVYGGLTEANITNAVGSINGSNIDINITTDKELNIGDSWIVNFSIPNDSSGEISRLPSEFMICQIYINDNVVARIVTDDYLKIKYYNWDYRVKLTRTEYQQFTAEYLGYAQPKAIVWDSNTQSPFYVGDYIDGDNSITSPTDAISIVGSMLPRFKNQIRIVLSGGEFDNIHTNKLAVDRAKHELYLRSRRHDNIKINNIPIYWIDVNQLIEYRLPNEDSLSYWLIKNISTSFGVDGTQSITAVRQYI